jgi:hypothetical protein
MAQVFDITGRTINPAEEDGNLADIKTAIERVSLSVVDGKINAILVDADGNVINPAEEDGNIAVIAEAVNDSRMDVNTQFVDEDGTAYGIKQVDNKPVFTTDGEVLEGNASKISVTDNNAEELLSEVLKQLKIMNVHLSLMTDMNVSKQEVE